MKAADSLSCADGSDISASRLPRNDMSSSFGADGLDSDAGFTNDDAHFMKTSPIALLVSLNTVLLPFAPDALW